MRKSRYSEEKIVRILKEVEAGKHVKDVCREYNISEGADPTPFQTLTIRHGRQMR